MNFSPLKYRFAFTLAEVLIALAIIGVIAAITIPSLIQSTQKQEYVSALQKEYSALSQAYNLLRSDNGGDITSAITGITGVDDADFLNQFATKLNVQRSCGIAIGCWYNSQLQWLNGTQKIANLDSYWNNGIARAALIDGSLIAVQLTNPTCSGSSGTSSLKICGSLTVDLNGFKGPNTKARDYFNFWITQTGIYPYGIDNDGYSCDASTASDTTNNGCTAKVIKEGAMNY